MKILEELQDWTKLKSSEVAAFTSLTTLNQGTLSLSEFIMEAKRLVDECGYTMNSEKLLRDTTVSGIQRNHTRDAFQKEKT